MIKILLLNLDFRFLESRSRFLCHDDDLTNGVIVTFLSCLDFTFPFYCHFWDFSWDRPIIPAAADEQRLKQCVCPLIIGYHQVTSSSLRPSTSIGESERSPSGGRHCPLMAQQYKCKWGANIWNPIQTFDPRPLDPTSTFDIRLSRNYILDLQPSRDSILDLRPTHHFDFDLRLTHREKASTIDFCNLGKKYAKY